MATQTRKNIFWITRTAVLLALIIVVQFLHLQQPVTGPLINMIILIAGISTGFIGGISIAFLSPWTAYITQTHAAFGSILPVVPFIMIGNAVYVCVFLLFRIKKKNLITDSIGIILGSIIKFLILYSAVTYILVNLKKPIILLMSFPQLITALIGGVLALILEQILKPSKILSK